VKLLIVDDGDRQTGGMAAGKGRGPSVDVLGCVPPAVAGDAVTTMRPDVIIVGRLGENVVPDVLAAIRRASPDVRILVETDGTLDTAQAVLVAGGCGTVAAGTEPAVLREAVIRAHAGELVLDDDQLRGLVEGISNTRSPLRRATDALTDREREVLRATAGGLGTSDIAVALGISPATVQTHVKNVLAKLGVHSKVEAMRVAWREGIAAVPA
jgi:DNA-binding NarL/FixJ family response regulator